MRLPERVKARYRRANEFRQTIQYLKKHFYEFNDISPTMGFFKFPLHNDLEQAVVNLINVLERHADALEDGCNCNCPKDHKRG